MGPSRAAGRVVVLFANTAWYLFNFRRSLALRLREEGWRVILLSPPDPYGARLTELGFDWRPLPMRRRSLNPLSELRLLLAVARLFRRERPDVVHGFTIKCAVYGSLAARLARVPARVNAVAGLGYVFISDSPRARLLRPLVKRLLRLALEGRGSRLVLQNPDDIALFTAAGLVRAEHVRLIPGSGVDAGRFLVPPPRGPGEGLPRVLLAARLLWDKGVAEFIQAARLINADTPRARFQLAGDPDPGNPASVSEADVEAWRAAGVVEVLGHVEDMPALLAAADVVVLPSYREGLPKTLIEAAMCARPLVTTDVPGCRHVVTDGEDGLLVPVRDGPALAAAIQRLLDDPALAERLGAAARVRALAEFDERSVVQRTLAVYEEVLADR